MSDLIELVGGPEDGQRVTMDSLPNIFLVSVYPARKYWKTNPIQHTVVRPRLGLYKIRCDDAGGKVESDGHTLFDWDGEL